MGEILFRGKVSKGNWIYGNLNFYPDINRTFIRKNNKELLPSFQTSLEEEVSKNTIGQYTGLTDKNGTKIFEGDIVKIDDKYIRYITYSGECSAFVKFRYIDISTSEFSGYLGKGYDNYKQTIEVIGNIHDNPELLESEVEGE